jgi:hypothetical protein
MLFVITGLAGIVPAQDSSLRTSLGGVVLDPTDAGVAGAKITLRQSGAAPTTATADAMGAFRFDSVQPGSYEIAVEHEGFKPATSKVRIGSRPASPLVIRLRIAEVRSVMTVSAQGSQVSTNAAENLDTVTLNRQLLDDLPILGQDYIAMMSRFLDAGSIATGGATVVVDGVEASRAGVSASAIQEVKINNDPYSAEYPRPGRSRIEIITKPGTADFHGTFNFLFRDASLDARDPFALTRPSEQRRIFEGSFTGPLGRSKKMSFLVSANREEEDQQAIVFAEGLSGPIHQTVPARPPATQRSRAA